MASVASEWWSSIENVKKCTFFADEFYIFTKHNIVVNKHQSRYVWRLELCSRTKSEVILSYVLLAGQKYWLHIIQREHGLSVHYTSPSTMVLFLEQYFLFFTIQSYYKYNQELEWRTCSVYGIKEECPMLHFTHHAHVQYQNHSSQNQPPVWHSLVGMFQSSLTKTIQYDSMAHFTSHMNSSDTATPFSVAEERTDHSAGSHWWCCGDWE